MSHFTKIQTTIQDLNLLKHALTDLGLIWQMNSSHKRGERGCAHPPPAAPRPHTRATPAALGASVVSRLGCARHFDLTAAGLTAWHRRAEQPERKKGHATGWPLCGRGRAGEGGSGEECPRPSSPRTPARRTGGLSYASRLTCARPRRADATASAARRLGCQGDRGWGRPPRAATVGRRRLE